MNIVTGYTGTPHITSSQDRAFNQGAIGADSYILSVGQELEPIIVSATEVRIQDGAVCHQGCVGVIDSGSYDSVTIGNGSQGMNRADLIVCRYTKDSGTNVEDLSLVCIQGTATSSTPSLPSYNVGSIQGGDSPVDMPLFRVNITGTSIDSVVQVADGVMTQAETDTLVGNTALNTTSQTITGALKEINDRVRSAPVGGKNIDSLTDTGVFYYNQSVDTGTFPSNTQYGLLINMRSSSTNFITQIARPNEPNTNFVIWARFKGTGTWGSWKSITFT